MFQDYKLAYSEEGDTYKEEAKSTITVEVKTNDKSMVF
jgi:hypothetical protein